MTPWCLCCLLRRTSHAAHRNRAIGEYSRSKHNVFDALITFTSVIEVLLELYALPRPCPSPPPSAVLGRRLSVAHSLCTVPLGCAGRVGPGTDDEASKGSLISVLRAFRLVRLFKLAQYPAARTLWTRKGAC